MYKKIYTQIVCGWKKWWFKAICFIYWLASNYNPAFVIDWHWVVNYQMVADALRFGIPAMKNSGFFKNSRLDAFTNGFENVDKTVKTIIIVALLFKLLLLITPFLI